jgi:hypothetical protein
VSAAAENARLELLLDSVRGTLDIILGMSSASDGRGAKDGSVSTMGKGGVKSSAPLSALMFGRDISRGMVVPGIPTWTSNQVSGELLQYELPR